ncbi:MAG: hypothetical protein ACRDFC_03765, partial [Ignavibacteria bacterium]
EFFLKMPGNVLLIFSQLKKLFPVTKSIMRRFSIVKIIPPLKRVRMIVFIFLLLFSKGCDKGLNPNLTGETGFSGRINFFNSWPPQDSVVDLRIAVFNVYPPDSSNILANLVGFSNTLPYNVNYYDYKILIAKGSYPYVVVAQRYGQNIFKDWNLVGVYTASGNPKEPSTVVVQQGAITPTININVDWNLAPAIPSCLEIIFLELSKIYNNR